MRVAIAAPAARESTAMSPDPLFTRYQTVRAQTEALCTPLQVEDYVVSSMTDVSPTKWHLAHTSWFFETFVLSEFWQGYQVFDPAFAYLFNSYYVQAGERHCRAQRGLVTRPGVTEVFAYRHHVDESMTALIDRIGDDPNHPAYAAIVLGLNHEQQHQELIVTDIKHVFWTNPIRPAYLPAAAPPHVAAAPQQWLEVEAGVYNVGHKGAGFAFDNETPAHRVFVEPFRIATRLVTNEEYAAFIADHGYARAELWLAAGHTIAQEQHREAPLYWRRVNDEWWEFTLQGERPINPAEPVTHISYFEADAFARWAGHRLPTEFEWEIAAATSPIAGTFLDSGRFHPAPATAGTADQCGQLFGDVWQWTQSAYVAYPGYKPVSGAIGEYNGKWMADQWVLRGASCATPRSHARRTYRNFFASDTRWQFSGLRLAASV